MIAYIRYIAYICKRKPIIFEIMTFTKTFDGKKFHYNFNGKNFRNSTKDFKYGCFVTSRESGDSWPVSLGNNAESTRKSMAHCYAHYCDMVVVEIKSEA